jgi:density-regulated protein DRP1
MGKKKGKGGESARDEPAEAEEQAAVDVSDAAAAAGGEKAPAAASSETTEEGPTISDTINVAGTSETRHVPKVPYCTVCSMPFEFCEWTPLFKQCKAKLEDDFREHFPEVDDDLEGLMAKLWINDDKAKRAQKAKGGGGGAAAPAAPAAPSAGAGGEGGGGEGGGGGGEGGEGAAAAAPPPKKDKKAKAEPEVLIELNNRNKKKHITVVKGLEHFEVDTAAAAKLFGKKFACGSALKKGENGKTDCIEIQGSCRDELPAFIVDKLKVSLDNIYVMLESKKVKAADAPVGKK